MDRSIRQSFSATPASAVCEAAPSILLDDPAPAYQLDDRLIG
jgi:hypothetical protein